jgi:c-di-GMP-binding flagellar brake protein YcgR
MTLAENKRTEARHDCYVPVESKDGSEFDQTKTVDISRHGIGFLSAHAIPINQKIAVEIALKPNTEPVLVIGVVKWVRKLSDSDQYRVGMTFSEVISGSPTRLNKYFNSSRYDNDNVT